MNQLNFYDYYAEQEEGEYLEFVNTSVDEIIRLTKKENYIDFWPSYLVRIAKKIKDTDLKDKFINKIRELIYDERYRERYEYIEGLDEEIFTIAEIKQILEIEINKKDKRFVIPMITKANISDEKWLVQQLDKILDIDESGNQISIDKLKLIMLINNEQIKNEYLARYDERLPVEYKKYLQIKKNPNYIEKKVNNYRNVKIGIDSNIIIGAEIEANNIINTIMRFTNQLGFEEYYQKSDATVPDGIEVVTPKFRDIPEELSKFCAMCDTLKEIGFYYDETQENASGQINLGIDYLDSTRAILNFMEIFGNSEELLFHISNKEGQQIRQSVYINSRFKAISEKIGTRIIDEDITRYDLIQLLTAEYEKNYNKTKKHIRQLEEKKDSICLRDGNRFEIRIPNGSTDYKVWIDNIRLFGKIMEVSKKCADIWEKDEPTKEDIKLLGLKEELSDKRNTLEDKLYILMDLLFDDDEIKQIYVDRFYTLEKVIERTKSKKYEDSIDRVDKGFGIIDFEEKYHSNLDIMPTERTVSYDPKTKEYVDFDGR